MPSCWKELLVSMESVVALERERHCVGYARMEVVEMPAQSQEESPTAPLKSGSVLGAVLVVG